MPEKTKNVVLLGATGSIGQSTLEVLRKHKDRLRLIGVACNKSSKELASICQEFDVDQAAIYNEEAYENASQSDSFKGVQLHGGMEGLTTLSTLAEADIVLVSIVGTLALKPALAAIEHGKDLALASKEILVMAGKFFTDAVKQHKVKLLPVDSEHNAIFQCLNGESTKSVSKVILTASGGMFRDRNPETFSTITPEEATCHPNWSMGKKITVDSATMANKGLELMEAKWLFDLDPDQLKVVIHPTSIIHSLVEFVDGSVLAQLSPPSMTFAIQNALLHPDRAEGTQAGLDFDQVLKLELSPPDFNRYPCLQIALKALKNGALAPTIYNAANEIAVAAFLEKTIAFTDIPFIIENTLAKIENIEPESLDNVLNADKLARDIANTLVISINQ